MEFDLQSAASAWALDPSVHHCNHGSYGAVPLAVRALQKTILDRVQSNLVKFYARDAAPAIAAARADIARFLGQQPGQIALVRNATEAASTVLSAFPWQSGDEAIVLDQAYGAVLMALQRAAGAAGAAVRVLTVPVQADEAQVLAQVEAAIGPRTRLLLVDHITSATARILPVQALADLCRVRGVAIAVDAAHAPGTLDTDLDALDADFWFGNLHKWVCAPPGCAVLRVAPRWQDRIRPLIVSWREPEDYPAPWDMLGTVDLSAWLAAPAAIAFFESLGWQRVRQANLARMHYGRDLLLEALGQPTGAPPPHSVPMGLVPLPDLQGGRSACAALQTRLGRDFGVETAITTHVGAYYLRVCGQLYNTPDDYQALARTLPQALRA